MKILNSVLIWGFHCANLILIALYTYPGSIFGHILYDNSSIQPKITEDFSIFDILISSNHLYAFVCLSIIGILAYRNNKKINLLIYYLLLLSIILEFLHIIIHNREFEFGDFFGNIVGVIVVVIIYKIKKKYVQSK